MEKPKKVGLIDSKVISTLGLPITEGTPIFLGSSNIAHMKSRHPAEYEKYGVDIPLILSYPDYIGINKKDNSIEYVKEYKIDNEYVEVAVRVSHTNNYFARSIYTLNKNRVKNFITKGTLKVP